MTTPAPMPARRTYASLSEMRGFRMDGDNGNGVWVSIAPMGQRSHWRHIGSGSPASLGALYEEVGQ